MSTIDNSKIFICGTFDDADVKVPAKTTLKAGTVLGLNASGDLVPFSTDNNVSAVAAQKATGELTFTGTADSAIPIGTKVKTSGNVVFETTETAAIPTDGTTVKVPARAVVAGTSGNIAASTTLSLSAAVTGISAVANGAAFTGGVDAVAQFIAEPTYILYNDITNDDDSAAVYPLNRVFVEGEVNKDKVIFTKTADASDASVLAAMKNNGFILRNVQDACL